MAIDAGIEVRCPHCDKTVRWTRDSLWKPFCSERCKLIDLGAWFEEDRAIPGTEPADPTLNVERD
jgi:endogenous inhibitor of DNA gyrase (YacG/DUF329 family)